MPHFGGKLDGTSFDCIVDDDATCNIFEMQAPRFAHIPHEQRVLRHTENGCELS